MQEIQKSIKGTASTLAKTVVGEEAEEGPYMFECLTCSLIQVKFLIIFKVIRFGICPSGPLHPLNYDTNPLVVGTFTLYFGLDNFAKNWVTRLKIL